MHPRLLIIHSMFASQNLRSLKCYVRENPHLNDVHTRPFTGQKAKPQNLLQLPGKSTGYTRSKRAIILQNTDYAKDIEVCW